MAPESERSFRQVHAFISLRFECAEKKSLHTPEGISLRVVIGLVKRVRACELFFVQTDTTLKLRSQSVGYSAGVKHVKGSRIIFMTDAALVRLVQRDPLLTSVSVLIIDEAHERSLNTDLVLGIAKQIMQDHRRQETFHVVVASATIDPKPFVKFFTGEPTGAAREKHVLDVEGRTFDVTLEYKPIWCHEGRLQIATRDLIGAVTEAMEVSQIG